MPLLRPLPRDVVTDPTDPLVARVTGLIGQAVQATQDGRGPDLVPLRHAFRETVAPGGMIAVEWWRRERAVARSLTEPELGALLRMLDAPYARDELRHPGTPYLSLVLGGLLAASPATLDPAVASGLRESALRESALREVVAQHARLDGAGVWAWLTAEPDARLRGDLLRTVDVPASLLEVWRDVVGRAAAAAGAAAAGVGGSWVVAVPAVRPGGAGDATAEPPAPLTVHALTALSALLRRADTPSAWLGAQLQAAPHLAWGALEQRPDAPEQIVQLVPELLTHEAGRAWMAALTPAARWLGPALRAVASPDTTPADRAVHVAQQQRFVQATAAFYTGPAVELLEQWLHHGLGGGPSLGAPAVAALLAALPREGRLAVWRWRGELSSRPPVPPGGAPDRAGSGRALR